MMDDNDSEKPPINEKVKKVVVMMFWMFAVPEMAENE
jgi:hypothetical protein